MVTTNNNNLAKKVRNLISCGIDKDPWQRTFEKKLVLQCPVVWFQI